MTAYIQKSKSDDYTTPKDLYDKLNEEFHFDFDPCPLNPTFDGFNVEWGGGKLCEPTI